MTSTDQDLVCVSNLTKRFGDIEVLKGIDFSVRAGEVVVIVGPSGSGKTTLLRSLNFLEMPTSGSVSVCGVEAVFEGGKCISPHAARLFRDIRSKTAMVFQSFNLFPHMTALQNVIEGLVSVKNVKRPEAADEGKRLLTLMGLMDKIDVYPSRLSGGQKQRVAIARSLAMKPEVMLFDEPTSALDPELRGEVLAVMRDIAKSGTTMIVVTHEMQFARDIADQVVFMDNGVIVETNPPERFFGASENMRVRAFLNGIA